MTSYKAARPGQWRDIAAALLLLAACTTTDGNGDDGALPDPRLAGEWAGEADVIVSWCGQDAIPLRIVVHPDASVTGTVGDARLAGATLRRNRGELGRALGVETDFIVQGALEGPLVAAEGIVRDGVNIPCDLEHGALAGAVHSTGAHIGPPETMVFTATFELVKTSADLGERTAALEPRRFGAIPNLTTFDGLWFAGQPSADDLARAREAGLATVLDVRKGPEHPFDEAAVAAQHGLRYVHVPWNGESELTDEVFDRLREELRTAPRPLLFHCGSANRVGAIWLAHRVLDAGLTPDEAAAEARRIGLSTDAYEQRAREYAAREGAAR